MNIEIIAEIGCNHFGKMKVAKQMIEKAAEVGAQYAKFQYYSTDEIIAHERFNPKSLYTQDMFHQIKKTEFTLEQLTELKEHCDEQQIEFLCTPFIKPARVYELNPLVKRWKIRERDGRDIQSSPLIAAALDTRKEIFISATSRPCDEQYLFHPRIKWLFTIPKYPATLEQLNLSRSALYDGYSNHIPSPIAPLITVILAKAKNKSRFILEIHVKKTKTRPIDDAVSFTFSELRTLINHIHEVDTCKVTPHPY